MRSSPGRRRVIDAYSGIGTIGMVASGKAKEVISVELNGEAVRDAIANAQMNKIKNIRFYRADAGRVHGENGGGRTEGRRGLHGPAPGRQRPEVSGLPAAPETAEKWCTFPAIRKP